RHLAFQGEELAALGHLHEDTLHTELAELLRDRFIRHALILTQEPEPPPRASAMVSNDASTASPFHATESLARLLLSRERSTAVHRPLPPL
ncbi:MAG: hypothetical protein ACJ75Z_05000, partial [Solirubrobacterales bacterium]